MVYYAISEKERRLFMLNKSLKVLIATILTIVAVCDSSIAKAAPGVSLPSSENAIISGFTVKRTMAVTYNCDQPILDPDISRSQVVGYCYNYIGKYRATEKVDGKYYDAILIKSCMSPSPFYDKKGNKRYGFSQYLQYSMTLNDKCTYQGNTPMNDTTGSTEYSVGISGGKDEASVSASVYCSSKYCEVTDMSNQNKNLFKVAYDYKPSIWDWSSSSERNRNVLFGQTWQMATCEWTTARIRNNITLNVYAKFGTSKSKNGSGMYMALYDYSSGKSKSYPCCYGYGS